MIKPTTDTKQLRESFYRVFKSRNPFEPAGQEDFPVRIVLYPTYGYNLEAEQFKALMFALKECREHEFYISMVEAEPDQRNWDGGEFSNHWVCNYPTYEEYMNIDLFLENALYSPSGSWGVLVSHEDHALLVCRQFIWDAFKKQYPTWKQDQEEFIKNWKYIEKESGADVKWLKLFLAHLYIS